jgi:cell division protein FtsB
MENQLKMTKLEEENKLLRAKTKALEDQGEYKELVAEAIRAMRNYSGQGEPDEY